MFNTQTLTKTEEDILVDLLTNPVIKKYLSILAMEDTKELLAFPANSKTAQEIAIAHATVQGKLSVISTLYSITKQEKEQYHEQFHRRHV